MEYVQRKIQMLYSFFFKKKSDIPRKNAPLYTCHVFILGWRSDHRWSANTHVCEKQAGQRQRASEPQVSCSWLSLPIWLCSPHYHTGARTQLPEELQAFNVWQCLDHACSCLFQLPRLLIYKVLYVPNSNLCLCMSQLLVKIIVRLIIFTMTADIYWYWYWYYFVPKLVWASPTFQEEFECPKGHGACWTSSCS